MYLDLKSKEREPLFFFMLNAFLQARMDTQHGSDGDEEVNMYIAHLLHSLVDGRFYVDHTDKLATSPLDVHQKVSENNGNRHKLQVYRTNADHRLVAYGLFDGFGEHQSLYRKTFTPNQAYLEEAQTYYGWAALFGARMPEKYRGLAQTLEKLAADFETYVEILDYMSAHYFNLIQQLSPGQMFHLERQAHKDALPQLKQELMEHMIKAYSQWRLESSAENQRLFQQACQRYQEIGEELGAAIEN
jgi:hypothetical protein